MKENRIEIAGQKLNIPDSFQLLQSMPDDPEGSVVYGMRNEGTICCVLLYPIDNSQAMPFDVDRISKGIHAGLGEKQGLIEIQAIQGNDGRKSVYSIVKTLREPSGVQYNLTLQIAYPKQLIHVQGYFDETGITGQRDASVHELAVKKKLVKPGTFDGWFEDPIDKDYKKGVLKNLSEDVEYDAMFPNHPLTVLRGFVNTVLELDSEGADETAGDGNAGLDEVINELGIDANDLEEMINEILPGLAMYVRDVNLNEKCLAAYQPGIILMERGFTDASDRVMGMKTSHRITILSNHMADFRDLEENTDWGLFVANHGAHFKVLDVYQYQGKTQILLLHLPDDERWKLFEKITLSIEEQLIKDCRERFENKCIREVIPELNTEEWLRRCSLPIGMDLDGNLYDVEEPVKQLDDTVLNMDYQITVRVIMQQLTDDTQKNIEWLRAAMERYKDHPRGSEIIKACARKLYDLLPENQRNKLDQVVGEQTDLLEKRLNEIRKLIIQKKPEEAKPLMDALAKEADENPMFREDGVSQFFTFREWFEECLYRHMYEPQKELRMAQYPYDEIYALQGSMYIDLKDFSKARECLQKALSWNPVNAQISFEYAETFKLSNDMETFFEESKKIQKFALHNQAVARFLRNVGFYFTENGKYQEAMMCFMRSLLYERDSKSAEIEINYLHQSFGTEIVMPDAEACQDFAKQYGFSLGPDNDLLGMLYAYGKHFLEEKQEQGAAYCFGILYELTDDPEIKKFLDQLGVKVDAEEPDGQGIAEASNQPGMLYLKNNKANAKGLLTDNGFVVLAGSRLFSTPTNSCPQLIRDLRKKYAKYIDENMILQKDLTFTSASQAASFVLFASTNGLTSWMDAAGTTLKALQG